MGQCSALAGLEALLSSSASWSRFTSWVVGAEPGAAAGPPGACPCWSLSPPGACLRCLSLAAGPLAACRGGAGLVQLPQALGPGLRAPPAHGVI